MTLRRVLWGGGVTPWPKGVGSAGSGLAATRNLLRPSAPKAPHKAPFAPGP
jgi:hypothetical protein